SDLSPGSTIGTSSLRRAAQLQAARPDIKIRSIRGNLDTRLKKLDAGEFDAIVLAAAGVKRLALTHRITEYLDMETMLPAVGQGALCIEIRKGDDRVEKAIAPLDDADTRIAVTTERAFLNRLEGGCQTPIAAHATLKNGMVRFVGLVADLDGRRQFRQSISGTPDMAGEMGIRLAEQLLDQGAGDILEKLKDLSND
ncbi:MAG: hydroxymethylbilane synthase, partial [Deltaproteobacteria bacterium]